MRHLKLRAGHDEEQCEQHNVSVVSKGRDCQCHVRQTLARPRMQVKPDASRKVEQAQHYESDIRPPCTARCQNPQHQESEEYEYLHGRKGRSCDEYKERG